MKPRHWRATALVVTVAVMLIGCAGRVAAPDSLAGLPRRYAIEGARAVEEIGRRHGGPIAAEDGFVAHYEADGRVAVLYAARASGSPVATAQMSRMVQRIAESGANAEGGFVHLSAVEERGIRLHSALGFGRIHSFYRTGATIVWLAADPPVAREALADTLRLLR